jgi:signal transduction histidine kinase
MEPGVSIEELREIDLFKGLSDEGLLDIVESCSTHYYQPGESCVVEGNSIDSVCFVKKGKVVVEIQIPQPFGENDRVVVSTLENGEIFAWSALVTGTLTASVRAIEPTEVLRVNATAFRILSEKTPRAGYIIMKNLTFVISSRLTNGIDELGRLNKELKESQQLLIQAEKLTSLGEMAASIAHEVNNPLTGVLVYIKLLKQTISDGSIPKETCIEYLSKVDSELTRCSWLIRGLLDFARQSLPALREFDCNDAINRALDIAGHSATLQKIEVIKQLQPSLPRLRADFDQITQVCTNLILNAIQAMSDGGKLTLLTSLEREEIKIEVRDTGCGIPSENVPKLFTPFFTTKRAVKGVGLGLAVSHGIIQRHRGRIEVQSKVGEGTSFSVHLPLNPESVVS